MRSLSSSSCSSILFWDQQQWCMLTCLISASIFLVTHPILARSEPQHLLSMCWSESSSDRSKLCVRSWFQTNPFVWKLEEMYLRSLRVLEAKRMELKSEIHDCIIIRFAFRMNHQSENLFSLLSVIPLFYSTDAYDTQECDDKRDSKWYYHKISQVRSLIGWYFCDLLYVMMINKPSNHRNHAQVFQVKMSIITADDFEFSIAFRGHCSSYHWWCVIIIIITIISSILRCFFYTQPPDTDTWTA